MMYSNSGESWAQELVIRKMMRSIIPAGKKKHIP
jgi:hypothetical protein